MLDQRRFQSSVGYSALLHVGVVAAFFVGVPWLIDAPYQSVPILTVEVVDDVLRTNLDEGLPGKPEDEPQDEVNRQSESDVAPAAASAPPPPEPPDRPAESESEAEASDAVALNLEGAVAETPPPKTEAEETNTPKAVAPPPTKPAEPRQPPQDNISSLVQNEQNTADKTPELGLQVNNLLDEAQRLANADEEEEKDEIDEILDDVLRQNTGQAVNVDKRDDGPLGADIITRLRAKIGKCWNPPSAIAGASTLIVDIIVGLDASGEVVSVRAKDAAKYATDDAFKLAAQAAERAFHECSPLIPPLAPEDYEKWQTLQFRFDPRGFLT